MTVHIDLPGSDTYLSFRERCSACSHEFNLAGTYEDSEKAVCPSCGSSDVEELYVSFPTNGPGFQKDYGTQSDRLRGGCAGSCGDDFDLGL